MMPFPISYRPHPGPTPPPPQKKNLTGVFSYIFFTILCLFSPLPSPQRPTHETVLFQVAIHKETLQSLPWSGEGPDSNPGLLHYSKVRYTLPLTYFAISPVPEVSKLLHHEYGTLHTMQ
jgi:hypothetical protein